MSFKISVIVPVYNSEQYLDQAIQSILNQTMKELEIILINDGSTDSSLDIANRYKDKDSRIKVLSQKNKGVSSARNYGLSVAKGKYVTFMDSDDYIDREMYECLYQIAEAHQLDLVISNFEQEIDGRNIVDILDIKSDILIEKKQIVTEIMPQFLYHEKLNTVCNKLYKKSIIDMFNINFPLNVALGEDRFFNINYFSNIKNLMYINYCGYHYREVEGSATRNILEKDYFKRSLEIYNEKLLFDWVEALDKDRIRELKTEKFINNVISYIHIYSNPDSGLSFKIRCQYLKNMINHPEVKQGIKIYINKFYSKKSLYEKLMIYLIRLRFLFGIQFLTAYSRFRCR